MTVWLTWLVGGGLRRFLPRSGIPLMSGKEVVVDLLAGLIIHVTGIHNHVGNVADYLFDPSFASAKIRPGAEIADVRGLQLQMVLQDLPLIAGLRADPSNFPGP